MTFKQHLEEQKSKLKLNRIIDLDSGFYMPVEEVTDFLRQQSIETVKWVMEMIEGKRIDGDAPLNAQDIGYNSAVDDIKSELNKAIE